MPDLSLSIGEENIVTQSVSDPRAQVEGRGDDAQVRITLLLETAPPNVIGPGRHQQATTLVYRLDTSTAERLRVELTRALGQLP